MQKAMEPFGQALRDFYYGGEDIPVIIVREDGYRDEMSVRKYFRTVDEFSSLEKKMLDFCKGKIVDLSAGVGADCLELQNRGFDVTAVEINSNACEIMKKRGVLQVWCSDLFKFSESGYDTILLYGRSIGNVQDLKGLEKFLLHAKKIVKKDGQIIFDSIEIRKTEKSEHLAYQQFRIESGGYFGEIRTRFEYKDIVGPEFGILHVDPDTVKKYCEKTGWNCEILYKEEEGNYLAKLTQK